ncbi:polysaccharide biosynthesis/export family protein [Zemynaea arenosa]|nr:SLBB domain-containing protein [Massilia arenosa]
MNEFQKFVHESTGKMLPLFGSEFFEKAPSTFAPILNAPVASDYPLGPGDEVLVRGWGSVDIDFRATIDRNGNITMPTIGTVALGGVRAGEAPGVVRAAVDRLYKGVTLNVSFGQLRSITIYVVGQASRPGTYTVSSSSTLVTALFASGGPNATGSLRHVQVKRGGRVMADLDLYSFIAKGDKGNDIRLLDGDTIYIPPALGYVALMGTVNNPAIYELLSKQDTLATLLDNAGGMPVLADPRRVLLERIDPTQKQPRTVEEFALDQQGLKIGLRSGDLVNVLSITPDFANAVVLRGYVDQPQRAPFRPGMHVLDLIGSKELLLSRTVLRKRNGEVGQQLTAPSSVDSVIENGDDINWEYAVIQRRDPNTLTVSVIPFNLGGVFRNPNGPDNVELQPGDAVTIFSQKDVLVPAERRQIYVRVEGEVNVPGIYQMTPGDTLQTLLAKAGGPTSNAYLFGTALYREQVRREQEVNLDKVAQRLERDLRNSQLTSLSAATASSPADAQLMESRRAANAASAQMAIARLRELHPTGRIGFGLSAEDRSFNRLPSLKMQSGDRLVIPQRPDFVQIVGAVNTESAALWKPDLTVGDYLRSAGVAQSADRSETFVLRADGSVASTGDGRWFSRGVESLVVMPGDMIVVPEKVSAETAWTRFVGGVKEWSQILANFGLGAAAIKVLK